MKKALIIAAIGTVATAVIGAVVANAKDGEENYDWWDEIPDGQDMPYEDMFKRCPK